MTSGGYGSISTQPAHITGLTSADDGYVGRDVSVPWLSGTEVVSDNNAGTDTNAEWKLHGRGKNRHSYWPLWSQTW